MRLILGRNSAILVLAMVCSIAGCAGDGQGTVTGTTAVPVCLLSGAYDLHASFYGAEIIGGELTIRIQNGGGWPEYNDNLVITVDDTREVVRQIAAAPDGLATFTVGPRGVPGILVHATFDPQWSCGRHKDTRLGENVGLWADNNPTTGQTSTITFRSIANLSEISSDQNTSLTDVSTFSFWLHDPRPIGPNPSNNPWPDGANVNENTPVGEATLGGNFRFEFSHAMPAQMFP